MNCVVCNSEASKYKCPCCDRRTCSLECNKEHKARWSCTGKRPRTNYTPTKDFADKDLISDLRFLDEVKRVKETSWRNLRRVALVFRPQEIPPHQRKLRYEARQRGIRLHYLPKGMTRNKCNSSWFDFRRGEICWDIDWMVSFLGNRQIKKKRVPESERVVDALTAALASLEVKEKLSVLMKRTASPSGSPVFFEFDLEATLKSQLAETELVEYPVLVVIREADRSNYNLEKQTSG